MHALDGAISLSGSSNLRARISGVLDSTTALRRNHDARALLPRALNRGEATLSRHGALVVDTGQHTGRSPRDKYIVRDAVTDGAIAWDSNAAMSRAAFERLKADVLDYVRYKEMFVQDLAAGADPEHQIGVTVYTELAWHSLFIRNLLTPAITSDARGDVLTIIDVPGFNADPARHEVRSGTVIACDFSERTIIIGGTGYAGEIKKAVFTFLNYLLPKQGVLPMHCSANVGAEGDVAIFFGLSGTGKTTLSATGDRELIGDDEHGWGPGGIFNFEGGCYAKAVGLSSVEEPQIYAATNRFGTVLENVVLAGAGEPLFADISKTENTRAAYPLSFVANASASGRAGHPRNIVMLAADAFGVLPPIARLSIDQAVYYFLSGFTAKVAGTEKGVKEPEPTFSTCFGAPFMPRRPAEYGSLLRKLLQQHGPQCWLVNTGWTGGPYGVGRRMPLKMTRALLDAALTGRLAAGRFRRDERFGFEVPVSVEGVPEAMLSPRDAWADRAAYDVQAQRLASMFAENFSKFRSEVAPTVAEAGPKAA